MISTTLCSATTVLLALCFCSNTLSASPPSNERTDASALERARALQAPPPELTYGGDVEHLSWWRQHESLLQDALNEWGRLHENLYEFNEHFVGRFVDPSLVRAVREKNLSLLADQIYQTDASGVYELQLFNQEFTSLFLEELEHYEASGIPLRRPNGMNRYGVILSDVGFAPLFNQVSEALLKPVALHLFPQFALPSDLQENYPFVVRYKSGQDQTLAEHTDASTVTVNVCLQAPSEEAVLFYNNVRHVNSLSSDANNSTMVKLYQPGRAVFHLGQHEHGVSPVDGDRSQLVIWMFGKEGYVRVKPYEEHEVAPHKWKSQHDWREPQPRQEL